MANETLPRSGDDQASTPFPAGNARSPEKLNASSAARDHREAPEMLDEPPEWADVPIAEDGSSATATLDRHYIDDQPVLQEDDRFSPLAMADDTVAYRYPTPTFGERLRAVNWVSWAFLAVFLLGAVMRFWGLADKPLHHDESLHAYFALQFQTNPAGYLYDPLLHGPFQFHLIPIFYMLGHLLGLSDGGANDFTVRILPALMGTGMVALPYWLRDQLGRFGALAMALLLAVTPAFVYFSRFVRDDIYVTCFTLIIVVAAIQYAQTRHVAWLLAVVAALTLSYTAMENTFFTIATFGSFLAGLVLWDLGPAVGRRLGGIFAERDRPLVGRVFVLTPFLLLMGVAALFGLKKLGELSTTINTLAAQHSGAADPLNPDVAIKAYEQTAVGALLLVSIAVAMAVIVGLLVRGNALQQQVNEDGELISRSALPPRTDPRTQPVLDTLLSTHWIRWFLAFVLAWALFAAFFWKVPTNLTNLREWGQGFQDGIGRGLLQGIYYWLAQQHVARGGQPWYYYLILLPLYEPLLVVFGLAGAVRALLQPTRFRIFLVYWFATNLVLYSWAGEKMPWLVIHMVLPLIALNGLAFEWIIGTLVRGARTWWRPTRVLGALGGIGLVIALGATSIATAVGFALVLGIAAILALGAAAVIELWVARRMARQLIRDTAPTAPEWVMPARQVAAAGSLALAVLLLLPTLWNTRQLAFVEPSVAPNEMLIYVQTTTDVQKVMEKINTLDQQLYQGTHQLHVGVTGAAVWPFAWYLHSYPNTLYNFTASKDGAQPEVIVADMDGGAQNTTAVLGDRYASHNPPYRLRWWWDESYKLPPCSATKTSQCSQQASWGTGVGPFTWIAFGAYPTPNCQDLTKAKCDPLNKPFNGATAAGRYWNWLWLRQNISGTQPGSTDFAFYVRNDLLQRVQP